MNRHRNYLMIITGTILAGILLSGCNLMGLLYPEATPIVEPTLTEAPLKEINICLGYEPRSLFPLRAVSSVEKEVQLALMDEAAQRLPGGEQQPILLTEIPSTQNGTVIVTPVQIAAGDAVVNSVGNLVAMDVGVSVFPSGCTTSDCVVTWDGVSPLQVDQTEVTFEIKDGVRWSDGEAVTPDDSVFAFNLAADPAMPMDKSLVDLTDSYAASDANTIEWTGMPGLVSGNLTKFFWLPMPSHLWGEIEVGTLLADENANRAPISYGPFMVEEWVAGSHIRMVKNPNYHRADEDLPVVDILTFKFLSAGDPVSLLTAASAECDLVSPSALDMDDILYLRENASAAELELAEEVPSSVEILAFGITPSSYDDNYYPYGADRPDFFGDVRVRKAIAYCLDRDTILQKLIGGVESAQSLLPSNHPYLSSISLDLYTFDPTLAGDLLQQAGWMDADINPNTPLAAISAPTIPYGVPLEINLLTTQSALRGEIAAEIASQLSSCGIGVNISQVPANELYQPGPDGLLFGRKFDLALLSLQTGDDYDCRTFQSDEIPAESNFWLGKTTGGANFFGFSDSAFDSICQRKLQSVADETSAISAAGEALRLLNEELPFIPLYHHPSAYLQFGERCGTDGNNGFKGALQASWMDPDCQNP